MARCRTLTISSEPRHSVHGEVPCSVGSETRVPSLPISAECGFGCTLEPAAWDYLIVLVGVAGLGSRARGGEKDGASLRRTAQAGGFASDRPGGQAISRSPRPQPRRDPHITEAGIELDRGARPGQDVSMDANLRWGHLDPASVPAWTELTNLLAESDGTEEFYDAADLAEELEESGFTPARDSWAVWAGARMVAYGQLRVGHTRDAEGRVRATLGGGVAPDHRGRGIGRELAERLERRAIELAGERHPGAPSYWRADGGLDGSSARALWSRRGYEAVRYFNLLTRPLPGPALEVPEVPAVLASPRPDQAEAVRRAHNLAFADHWGTAPQAPEPWRDHWTARSSRLELSTLALGPDGSVLSYVLAAQWVERELYVNLVGTVPAARGRGLAAACLARTLGLAAAAADLDRVDLDVDSESPTGATRLYDRLGFTVKKTFAAMQRDASIALAARR